MHIQACSDLIKYDNALQKLDLKRRIRPKFMFLSGGNSFLYQSIVRGANGVDFAGRQISISDLRIAIDSTYKSATFSLIQGIWHQIIWADGVYSLSWF